MTVPSMSTIRARSSSVSTVAPRSSLCSAGTSTSAIATEVFRHSKARMLYRQTSFPSTFVTVNSSFATTSCARYCSAVMLAIAFSMDRAASAVPGSTRPHSSRSNSPGRNLIRGALNKTPTNSVRCLSTLREANCRWWCAPGRTSAGGVVAANWNATSRSRSRQLGSTVSCWCGESWDVRKFVMNTFVAAPADVEPPVVDAQLQQFATSFSNR
mmetsp:Transcript_368/g.734  ORF Transcript_368/g.734 Transcript_368/m.734 type:complete len:213 (+) Transcript_368:5068-5706(+)